MIFHPRAKLVMWWYKVMFVTSAAAVLIDPLFLYILRINYRTSGTHYMIGFDKALLIAATTFRTIADVLCGLVLVFFKFCTARAGEETGWSRVKSGLTSFFVPSVKIRQIYYYLKSGCFTFTSFVLVDFLAFLLLPQVTVVVGFCSIDTRRIRLLTPAMTWLHLVLFIQLVPRLVRFYQLYQDVVVKSSYAIRKAAFVWTLITIFFYITAAHVAGAFWYSFSILRETDCWQLACRNHAGCDYTALLTFGNDGKDYSFLNRTCPKGTGAEPGIEYGMFADAVKSGMLESKRFDKKFL